MEIVKNQLQVAKIKLAYIVSLVIGVFLMGFVFTSSFFALENYIMFFFAVFLLLFFLYLIIIKPEYVYFAKNKNKIIIKNYPARPILRNYKAYEINLNDFYNFNVNKRFFNKKLELILTIKTKKGEGSYPPISLSALSNSEIKKLLSFLGKYSKNKN